MYFAYTWARPPLHCLLAVFIRRSRLFKVRSVKRDWSIHAYAGLCVQKAKEGCHLVYAQKYFHGFRISTEIDHRDWEGTETGWECGDLDSLQSSSTTMLSIMDQHGGAPIILKQGDNGPLGL